AEFARDTFAIENDGGSSEGAGAKWKNIRSNQAITKTLSVAFKSFDLAEQVMRESDWLGTLQMCVARHDNIEMLFGEIKQRDLQSTKLGTHLAALRFHIKPKIERNLVVSAARGVQLRTGGADSFRERGFDIHVHVFERSLPLEFSGVDLLLDRAQSVLDLLPFIAGYDSCLGERRGVHGRSRNII